MPPIDSYAILNKIIGTLAGLLTAALARQACTWARGPISRVKEAVHQRHADKN